MGGAAAQPWAGAAGGGVAIGCRHRHACGPAGQSGRRFAAPTIEKGGVRVSRTFWRAPKNSMCDGQPSNPHPRARPNPPSARWGQMGARRQRARNLQSWPQGSYRKRGSPDTSIQTAIRGAGRGSRGGRGGRWRCNWVPPPPCLRPCWSVWPQIRCPHHRKRRGESF